MGQRYPIEDHEARHQWAVIDTPVYDAAEAERSGRVGSDSTNVSAQRSGPTGPKAETATGARREAVLPSPT